jgi:hypothetical protein
MLLQDTTASMSIPGCSKNSTAILPLSANAIVDPVVVNNFITHVLRLNESPERAFISVPDENIRASHGPPRGILLGQDDKYATQGRRNVYGLL